MQFGLHALTECGSPDSALICATHCDNQLCRCIMRQQSTTCIMMAIIPCTIDQVDIMCQTHKCRRHRAYLEVQFFVHTTQRLRGLLAAAAAAAAASPAAAAEAAAELQPQSLKHPPARHIGQVLHHHNDWMCTPTT